jgi:hypothetical protein
VTGSNGRVSKELFPGTYWFRATYNNTSGGAAGGHQRDPLVQFQTSSITVEVKDQRRDGLERCQGGLPSGRKLARFRCDRHQWAGEQRALPRHLLVPGGVQQHVGGEQQQDGVRTPLVQFQTSSITVEVKDSGGTALSDARWLTVRVELACVRRDRQQWAGEQRALPRHLSGSGRRTTTRSAEQQQDIGATSLVQFQTSNIVAEVKTCGGAVVCDAKVDYRPGGSWLAFGVTSSDGRVSKELFPGTYWFRAGYNNTSTEKQQDVGTTPLVAFQTTKVSFQFSGAIQYRPGGSWLTFTKPSIEMFPGSYLFKFGGLEQAVTVEG